MGRGGGGAGAPARVTRGVPLPGLCTEFPLGKRVPQPLSGGPVVEASVVKVSALWSNSAHGSRAERRAASSTFYRSGDIPPDPYRFFLGFDILHHDAGSQWIPVRSCQIPSDPYGSHRLPLQI